MPFKNVAVIVDAAKTVLEMAYLHLVEMGIPPEHAEATVMKNFERVNNNPNLVLSTKELCHPHIIADQ